MAGQPGFFDSEERLRALSAAGDPLRLAQVIDFEVFRSDLETALSRSDRTKGGRPPYDAVLMFKVLVLQTLYTLSDDQTEYQLKDRLSFMRFTNDPTRKGQLAARKRLFGDFHRYTVAPVHTRFDAVEWFVWDAHTTDDVTGRPAVIRQASSEEEAVRGL